MRATPRFVACFVTTLFVSAMLLIGVAPRSVQAAIKGCRADPIVVLSDGSVLRLAVAIDANPSDVAAIHYTIHGPHGTSIETLVFTQQPKIRKLEHVVYIDDAPANTYITETVVMTHGGQVRVEASTTFGMSVGGESAREANHSQRKTGWSGETLRVELRR
jgi:hypothetical protein